MNYTKRRIKKYTHRKININRKTNNRKIMRKTRRNNIMRVKVGGTPPIQPFSKNPKTNKNSGGNDWKKEIEWLDVKKDVADKKIVDYLTTVKSYVDKQIEPDPSVNPYNDKQKKSDPSVNPYNDMSDASRDFVTFTTDAIKDGGLRGVWTHYPAYLKDDPPLLRKTFYFNLLKYVVCNYDDVFRKFTAEFIQQLFSYLEESGITGMFPLDEYEDACIIVVYVVKGIKPDLDVGNGKMVYSISNTIINLIIKRIASYKPMCPYNQNCYRTENLIHMNEFAHKPIPPGVSAPPSKRSRILK